MIVTCTTLPATTVAEKIATVGLRPVYSYVSKEEELAIVASLLVSPSDCTCMISPGSRELNVSSVTMSRLEPV